MALKKDIKKYAQALGLEPFDMSKVKPHYNYFFIGTDPEDNDKIFMYDDDLIYCYSQNPMGTEECYVDYNSGINTVDRTPSVSDKEKRIKAYNDKIAKFPELDIMKDRMKDFSKPHQYAYTKQFAKNEKYRSTREQRDEWSKQKQDYDVMKRTEREKRLDRIKLRNKTLMELLTDSKLDTENLFYAHFLEWLIKAGILPEDLPATVLSDRLSANKERIWIDEALWNIADKIKEGNEEKLRSSAKEIDDKEIQESATDQYLRPFSREFVEIYPSLILHGFFADDYLKLEKSLGWDRKDLDNIQMLATSLNLKITASSSIVLTKWTPNDYRFQCIITSEGTIKFTVLFDDCRGTRIDIFKTNFIKIPNYLTQIREAVKYFDEFAKLFNMDTYKSFGFLFYHDNELDRCFIIPKIDKITMKVPKLVHLDKDRYEEDKDIYMIGGHEKDLYDSFDAEWIKDLISWIKAYSKAYASVSTSTKQSSKVEYEKFGTKDADSLEEGDIIEYDSDFYVVDSRLPKKTLNSADEYKCTSLTNKTTRTISFANPDFKVDIMVIKQKSKGHQYSYTKQLSTEIPVATVLRDKGNLVYSAPSNYQTLKNEDDLVNLISGPNLIVKDKNGKVIDPKEAAKEAKDDNWLQVYYKQFSNPVSGLPEDVDNLLQDFAQMTDKISYGDIIKFSYSHKPSDVKKLRDIAKQVETCDSDPDNFFDTVDKEIVSIVKGYSKCPNLAYTKQFSSTDSGFTADEFIDNINKKVYKSAFDISKDYNKLSKDERDKLPVHYHFGENHDYSKDQLKRMNLEQYKSELFDSARFNKNIDMINELY